MFKNSNKFKPIKKYSLINYYLIRFDCFIQSIVTVIKLKLKMQEGISLNQWLNKNIET